MISRCSGASRSISAGRVGEPADQDDRAVVAPARAGDLRRAAGRRAAASTASATASAEPRVVGDQDRLRRLVVLGLRQQVGGDRSADRRSRRRAPRPRTGRRSCRCRPRRTPAAWPRRHRRCRGRRSCRPARSSPCRRPARRSPARRRRGRSRRRRRSRAAASTSGLSLPSGRRHDHRDARRSRRPCAGDGVHQHRGGIARRAARHVEPDRVDRASSASRA